MLCNDPKRLRFLSIDLRSRRRRRWLLVVIYLAAGFQPAVIGADNHVVPSFGVAASFQPAR